MGLCKLACHLHLQIVDGDVGSQGIVVSKACSGVVMIA
jgi:hypothetical protein